MERPLVLVIDDDDGIREGIVDLLEEEGFASVASVTLLMKETLVRVAEPRLVPAGVR